MSSTSIQLALSCLLIFSLCSCRSLRTEEVRAWERDAQLVPLDTATLNGRFSNAEKEQKIKWLLWDLISMYRSSYSTDVVEIRVVGPDTVRFSLIRGPDVIDVRELKYDAHATHIRFADSEKGGYAPLVWGKVNFKSGLGVTADSAVSIINIRTGSVFLLFLPVYPMNTDPMYSIYQRVP